MKTKVPFYNCVTEELTDIDISALSHLNEEAIETLHDRSCNGLLKVRNPLALATMLVKTAKLLQSKGSYEPAHQALTTALRLRLKHSNKESIAGTYYRLSELSCKREDFTSAIRYARLAKAYLEAGSNKA